MLNMTTYTIFILSITLVKNIFMILPQMFVYCTWAFKLSEQAGSNEGYGSAMISGRVDVDPEYPGCPYCGSTGWVSCGNCGKLTCYNGEGHTFTCTWCGQSGELQSAETFDLSGSGY